MNRFRLYLLLAVVLVGAMAVFPGKASADGLTGTFTESWLFPNTSTVFATDSLTVGATYTCPTAFTSGPLNACAGFSENGSTISSTANSITYTEAAGDAWSGGAFNGFEYSGLTFTSGSLIGVSLATNIVGLSAADVSISGGDIFINYQGLSTTSAAGGPVYATLTLQTPEPGSLLLLSMGLLGLLGMTRRKLFS
jgi:hypothetical protein